MKKNNFHLIRTKKILENFVRFCHLSKKSNCLLNKTYLTHYIFYWFVDVFNWKIEKLNTRDKWKIDFGSMYNWKIKFTANKMRLKCLKAKRRKDYIKISFLRHKLLLFHGKFIPMTHDKRKLTTLGLTFIEKAKK